MDRIRVKIPLPDDLHPQTRVERSDMAVAMGAWCAGQKVAAIKRAVERCPDGEPVAVTFVGVSSVVVPRGDEPVPESADDMDLLVLAKRRKVWTAFYDVEIDRDASPLPAQELAEIMFPEGKHE